MTAYLPAVAELLAGAPVMPLGCGSPQESARPRLAVIELPPACRAGLWLRFNFLDESHGISQDLHTPEGSLWHGMMHRREGDFSNAKYWFRHVGRHAIFGELAPCVSSMCSRVTGLLAGKLERWQPRLITSGGWEPFAFIDLCVAAETDAELRAWCEEVQFVEMMLLLASTYRAAVG